jgi:hypothetical protein
MRLWGDHDFSAICTQEIAFLVAHLIWHDENRFVPADGCDRPNPAPLFPLVVRQWCTLFNFPFFSAINHGWPIRSFTDPPG